MKRLERRNNDSEEPETLEETWASIVHDYEYGSADHLDREIAKYCERGYVDEHSFKEKCKERANEISEGKSKDKLRNVWKLYHGSLGDDAKQVISGFRDAIESSSEYISQWDISATIILLRELEQGGLADQLISKWLSVQDELGVLEIEKNDKYFPENSVKDTNLIAAIDEFNNRELPQELLPSLDEVAAKIIKEDKLDTLDVRTLKQSTPNELAELFVKNTKNFRLLVKSMLNQGYVRDPDDPNVGMKGQMLAVMDIIEGRDRLGALRAEIWRKEIDKH